jgi:kynureninase
LPIVRVSARPADTLAERIAALVHDRVACVLVSSVLFATSEIVPHLEAIAHACVRHGADMLVDAYHHLNVVPFDLHATGLDRAFVVGGGYKYCQLGEGNCFLRIPPDCQLRPVITGWFSEFANLAAPHTEHEVQYGRGAERFAGATYDPTSHYRAVAVFDFHQQAGLTPERLREINMQQTALLEREIRRLDISPRLARLIDVLPGRRGGFIALQTAHAGAIVQALRARGVFADSRGATLRLGPAPYLSDDQLRSACEALHAVLNSNVGNPTD